jgi:NADH-ubiquinone oxidoreductase chain 4
MIIPAVAGVLFALESPSDQSRKPALLVSGLVFVLSLVLWAGFDSSYTGYQFVSGRFGIDGISLWFILLTTFTIPVCILAQWNTPTSPFPLFLLLEAALIGLFASLDLVLFYVFFEAVLIPLFLIVAVWGASADRIRAAYLLFLYTLFGSLFMLLAFLHIISMTGTSDLRLLAASDIGFSVQRILWIGIFISFAVKTPLVPVHIWLPRAHAEAPVGGSMILAGLILKLASYGFLRILLPILPEASYYFAPAVQTIALISLVYASFATIRQTDIKALVAYSSICHVAVVVAGTFSNSLAGIEGAMLLSLAHGLISPGLFFLCGGVLYDRFHTRVIRYYSGLTSHMPIAMALFLVLILANAGTPLTLNWLGEFLSLAGTALTFPIIAALMATSVLFSACYSMWLFVRIAYGRPSEAVVRPLDLNRREFVVLASLIVPALVLGIIPGPVLSTLHPAVTLLLGA